MKDRETIALNCPRNVAVNPLEKEKFFGVVSRHCSKTNKSYNFLMMGGLTFCLEDCSQKKIIDKNLPIIGCPYDGVTFPIRVTKGKSNISNDRYFFCDQAYEFTNITYNSFATGNGIATCDNWKSCKSHKEIERFRVAKK